MHKYIDEILQYIRDQFVSGKVSSAKNMIYDCVVVTQNRHCITILDRAAYGELWMCGRKEGEGERKRERVSLHPFLAAQNPFYMKETRLGTHIHVC